MTRPRVSDCKHQVSRQYEMLMDLSATQASSRPLVHALSFSGSSRHSALYTRVHPVLLCRSISPDAPKISEPRARPIIVHLGKKSEYGTGFDLHRSPLSSRTHSIRSSPSELWTGDQRPTARNCDEGAT
jgi:hypothetical protein